MIRTQIQLDPAQAAALRQLAAAQHRSMAAVIRQAIDRFIEDAGREARRRRAMSVVGAFSGGPGKFSENHDDLLADEYLS